MTRRDWTRPPTRQAMAGDTNFESQQPDLAALRADADWIAEKLPTKADLIVQVVAMLEHAAQLDAAATKLRLEAMALLTGGL